MNNKRLLEEKCQTIEQLKTLIEELKSRHEKKEHELIKHIGMLYNDLQQTKKKMAHLILKYQKLKKVGEISLLQCNDHIKTSNDSSTQTEPINSDTNQVDVDLLQPAKYYTLQSNNDHLQYICATPQPQSDHSLSSPSLSTTDQSSSKHHESSSSAYNTAESLPSNTSSTYYDELHSLERVLNAAGTMYTTQNNLQHTIKLQEELFRQQLRLRGIDLSQDKDKDGASSEHFYDNIDSETSDFEKRTIAYRNRSLPWQQKKQQRTVRFSLQHDDRQKVKLTSNKIKCNEQYYSLGRRKSTNHRKSSLQHSSVNPRKFFSSNMLTVTIT